MSSKAMPPRRSKRRRTSSPAPPVSPDELIPASKRGDDATVASALRNPLTDPNMLDSAHRESAKSALFL